MTQGREDPVHPERWSRYAGQALEGGLARAAYNSWLSQVTSLSYMLRFQPPPARVLSIGCGVAFFDVLVASHGYQVTSLDSDPQVLEAAGRTAERFGVHLELRLGDAFDLKEHHDSYDVAFSAGLVEHWWGERTAELVAEHARCAPLVQVEVPTRHTLKIKSIPEVLEDAHLYGPREFAARVRQAGLRVEKVYPNGGVPTRARAILEHLVPPVAFRQLQLLTGYCMGVGVVARRT